jgi:hypothetical protein
MVRWSRLPARTGARKEAGRQSPPSCAFLGPRRPPVSRKNLCVGGLGLGVGCPAALRGLGEGVTGLVTSPYGWPGCPTNASGHEPAGDLRNHAFPWIQRNCSGRLTPEFESPSRTRCVFATSRVVDVCISRGIAGKNPNSLAFRAGKRSPEPGRWGRKSDLVDRGQQVELTQP